MQNKNRLSLSQPFDDIIKPNFDNIFVERYSKFNYFHQANFMIRFAEVLGMKDKNEEDPMFFQYFESVYAFQLSI